MNALSKRFGLIMSHFGVYLLFFLAVQYLFKSNTVSIIVLPIYGFFYLLAFMFFYKGKLKISGKVHFMWIFASAMLFRFILVRFGIKIVSIDYLYGMLGVLALSLVALALSFIDLPKKLHLIASTVYLVIFVGFFVTAILLNRNDTIWLFVLIAFKVLPHAVSYHFSHIHLYSYGRLFYFIYFAPMVYLLNIYFKLTKSHNKMSIDDLLSVD